MSLSICVHKIHLRLKEIRKINWVGCYSFNWTKTLADGRYSFNWTTTSAKVTKELNNEIFGNLTIL